MRTLLVRGPVVTQIACASVVRRMWSANSAAAHGDGSKVMHCWLVENLPLTGSIVATHMVDHSHLAPPSVAMQIHGGATRSRRGKSSAIAPGRDLKLQFALFVGRGGGGGPCEKPALLGSVRRRRHVVSRALIGRSGAIPNQMCVGWLSAAARAIICVRSYFLRRMPKKQSQHETYAVVQGAALQQEDDRSFKATVSSNAVENLVLRVECCASITPHHLLENGPRGAPAEAARVVLENPNRDVGAEGPPNRMHPGGVAPIWTTAQSSQ